MYFNPRDCELLNVEAFLGCIDNYALTLLMVVVLVITHQIGTVVTIQIIYLTVLFVQKRKQ